MALANLVTAEDYERDVLRLRSNAADCLAPAFRTRSDAAIVECNRQGYDVVSFETCRCDELARLYFAHGVSKSPNADFTWHHYGLARDVISKARGWDVYPDQDGQGGDPKWYNGVFYIARAHGIDLGADWVHFRDFPHWQMGGLRPTPRDAPAILKTQGMEAVWRSVGALAV